MSIIKQAKFIINRGHPWICEDGVAPDKALDPAVLSRLKQFSAMNKLKKMALMVSKLVLLFTLLTNCRREFNNFIRCIQVSYHLSLSTFFLQ